MTILNNQRLNMNHIDAIVANQVKVVTELPKKKSVEAIESPIEVKELIREPSIQLVEEDVKSKSETEDDLNPDLRINDLPLKELKENELL